jgi:Lon protease-like protein
MALLLRLALLFKGGLPVNRELALFPLNTVLFPGMPLHLHIFEPRYKQMIGECVAEKKPFGVVLIRSGQEVGDALTETHEIGTMARVTQVQRLPNGEMNIATVGQERFRIARTHTQKPYLTGVVDEYPLLLNDSAQVRGLARGLSTMMTNYLRIYAQIGDTEPDAGIPVLPTDPLSIAFLTAVTIKVPIDDKQALLGVPDLQTLLHVERKMLARELAILRHLVAEGPRWRDTVHLFSPN